MEQIVSQIVGPVVNILTGHITKHLGYVTSSTKHVTDMRNRMMILEGKRKDVIEHMERNKLNNKEIPALVEGWLGEVENVKKEVQSISSNDIGCLHMKLRYRAGRNAFKTIKEIERLINEEKDISWSDASRPLGRVDSKPAPSLSLLGEITQNDFKSRDKTFKDALKFLQQDDKSSQVIALCGMGGVGKTTMMEQLKKVAEDNKMFDWIVKVVIGQNPNMFLIQKDIAEYLGDRDLPEASQAVRADHLYKKLVKLSHDKKKILVILDDVWEKIELKYIGLTSPLTNGIKLFLTSRSSNICNEIAAYVDSNLQIVRVDVLEEAEAQNFFSRKTGVIEKDDHDKYLIGCDIVKKCGCLPLAIELIASTLKYQEDYAWRNTLNRLKNNDLDKNVQEIIKISYEHIKDDDDREIFLHCGLFPEDANIPIEDLTRYAWGLKLLEDVSTLREARDRTNTCVRNLINANLLILSDQVGCVKIHDLVLSFVLGRVSKGDHPWIINHGDVSKWGGDDMSESWKRISLTCMGMYNFPREFKYPNLSFLQLMHGELSLKFPEDFYENMVNLKVIAYYKMQYPLLPRSLQCSTNLKSLLLHECKVMFDCSFVGYLENLEVLSFAHCGISKLPSMIGNLKKLKLLDLTGCVDLHVDDGVFKNFKSLEELYMKVSYLEQKAVRFTNANFEELKILSSQLCTLEVEFVEWNTRLKNVSFKKLDKFKISIGCLLEEENDNEKYSSENTLKLVTSCSDLLDCKISELFKKTEKLHLQVEDMIRLEDVVLHHEHSFFYLRDLVVSNCAKLIYLFPISVAIGLRKLERLKISSCFVLEALVHNDGREINNANEMIKFEKLKFMSLEELPNLVSLFLIDNVVELPQLIELKVDGLPNFTSIYPDKNNISALLNSQVKITKLEILKISRMEKLKQICVYEIGNTIEEEANNISMLRKIEVVECDSLVNMFPTNPMRLLNRLEELQVFNCRSIKQIFNIDLDCVGLEVSSSLRSIHVSNLENLRELWRIKGVENKSSLLIHGFEAVERIDINWCMMFRNVFTPTNTITFDMRALVGITITNIEWNLDSETEVRRRKEGHDNISIVIFPSNLYMHSFHCLRALTILGYNVKAKVVFEIESTPTTSSRDMVTATNNQQPPLLPNLQVLELCCMDNMSHIWKCNNWNKFLIFQQQSSFLNLTTIKMWSCNSIKYLFSPLMAKLLSNLKTIDISDCDGMEEVVSNRDDKHEEEMTTSTTTFFPHLHLLSFGDLVNLNRIGGGGGKSTTSVIHDQFEFSPVGVVSWSLCQYSREINIYRCNGLSSVIPSNVLGQMQKLQVLKVQDCKSLMKVFETQGINNNVGGSSSTNIDEGSGGTDAILRQESINVPQLSNLKKLVISSCNLLQLVFTFSTLGSLEQLEELMVKDCDAMKVIVKKENGEQSKVVEFPRLKSLELRNLPNLDGFYLGMNDFNWPLLEKAIIGKCPQIMKFTSGWSTTPALKDIHTSLGKHSLECGLNFHLKTSQTRFPSSESTSLEQFPWSFHNLIELHMERDYDVKCIIPSNELLQLQKLERIRIQHCDFAKEVFEVEAMEGTNSEESQTIIQIPNLTQMELEGLSRLKYIWKSSHRVLEFPNLTTLSIKFCNSLKHVFNSSMVGSLLQLQHLHIFRCQDLEVIVKEEESESKTELIAKEEEEESELELIVKEEEEESEVFEVESQTVVEIPKLREVELTDVESLKYIWKGTNHGIVLQFPNLTKLSIYNCKSLEHVFTSSMVGSLQQLQELYVSICPNMEVIVKDEEEVEEQEVKSQTIVEIPNLTQMKLFNLHSLKYIWKSNHHHRTILEFPSLTTLVIHWCESLEHAFTSSMVGSLQQLQDLHIRSCKNMEVIVKEEEESESDCDAKVKQPVTFPCLKSLKLDGLKSLKGFCLGNDDFSWPSLHTLEIIECPQMTVFTNGHVATPALDVIDTRFGRFYIREDLNSFIKTKQHEGFEF